MADTAEQMRFFATCDLGGMVEKYQNVVDCCICGILFLDAEAEGDHCRLSVEVKMRLTQDMGRKICNRYEKLRLEMEGRQEVVAQQSKTLREYKCPNCGGSVDILRGGMCAYCNTAVDYRNFGWIITSYMNQGQPENPYAKILAEALEIYGIVLCFSLVFMVRSEEGRETLELWQSIGRSSKYLGAGTGIENDIINTTRDPEEYFPGPFRGKMFVIGLLGKRNSMYHFAIYLPQYYGRKTNCQICCGQKSGGTAYNCNN